MTSSPSTSPGGRRGPPDHLADALGDLPTLGEQTLTPDRFDRFGAAGSSPSGDRVAFSAFAYAMLTTVSLIGLLDPVDLTIDVLAPPAVGDVERFVWSPDGRYVATVLGTARAEGDRLQIDDVRAGGRVGVWTGEDVLDAAERWARTPSTTRPAWTPRFRDVTWSDGGDRLTFATADPTGSDAAAAVRWAATPGEATLELP